MFSSNLIRKQIRFYGYVQGVGFRWRARYAAGQYGCTGWVRNEWDGCVIMEIQGTEEAIDKVLSVLDNDRYIRIEYMEVERVPIVERERGFRAG